MREPPRLLILSFVFLSFFIKGISLPNSTNLSGSVPSRQFFLPKETETEAIQNTIASVHGTILLSPTAKSERFLFMPSAVGKRKRAILQNTEGVHPFFL